MWRSEGDESLFRDEKKKKKNEKNQRRGGRALPNSSFIILNARCMLHKQPEK